MPMQNVHFKSVGEFLDFLPEDELKIVEQLRELVFMCIPDASEKLAYNVPYYKRYRNICFIWPATILWGKKKTYEGVRFGFTNGYLLTDEKNYLSKEGRKKVYWKDFKVIKQNETKILESLLYEAALIDALSHPLHPGRGLDE